MVKRNRVVVTGMGVLAANGIGLQAFWESLLQCRSGIGPITHFDAAKFKTRIAGEIKGFDPAAYIEPEMKPKRMARHTQLAYAATMMALEDAGLEMNNLSLPSPTPVVIGVSTSAIDVIESVHFAVDRGTPNRAPVTSAAASIPQAAANTIADRIGAYANATTVSSACPSGLDALAEAAAMIKTGEVEAAVAGGADAPITPLTLASFIGSGLVSASNGEPELASRPFDLTRESGVLAEGAGIFVLENYERALARGARSYVEIIGYGKQRDIDRTKPASGLLDSMKLALANASRSINDVDYISAYGTGDPILDSAEVGVIKQLFGARAYQIPVSSIKGVTGNALGASGPMQVVASALAIRDRQIPPTANLRSFDPSCDLDFVPRRPRRAKIDCALVNVRGIGGSASTLVLNRPQDR